MPINSNGDLLRTVHNGYLVGIVDWASELIGTSWDSFVDLVASGDGVIHGIKRDGSIYFTRYRPQAEPGRAD